MKMDESKVEKKRTGKRGIPENLMDEVIEKASQTHHNTLGHDETTEPRVDDGPETEVTGDETGKAAVGTTAAADPSPIKKRGRPKGAKNKPKPSPRRRLREPFPIKFSTRKKKKKSSSDKMVMVRFTTCIPSDLIERLKNCVYFSPGKTVTEVVSSGVKRELQVLEKKNRGMFKDRPNTELNAGRKIK